MRSENKTMALESLFDIAPLEAQQILKSASHPLFVKKGDSIYRAGETPEFIFGLQSGMVGLILHGENGQDHLVRLFKRGQIFGHRSLLGREKYHATSYALENCSLLLYPKQIFIDCLGKFPDMAEHLIRCLAKDLGAAELRIALLTEKTVRSRVAQALIALKELYPNHQWTRKEIAEFCSSTTPTVIRTLGRFEEQGLISQIGRDIQVLNRDGLLDLINDENDSQ